MNKYKKLLSNTLIFGIGTFSSKILVFLLMPLYTSVLTKGEYGTADLIMQTGNLIIPLASMGMFNALIRFGLDKKYKKDDVFSTAVLSLILGFLILLLFFPLINLYKDISGYVIYVYLFVLMSCLHSTCSQFCRSMNLVKLFAFDGILCTFNTIVLNVLFLVVFKMGIVGYVLANILADFISAVFLFCYAKLSRYLKFQRIRKSTAVGMLKYAIPLIPTNIFWWITNVSDRYIVTALVGADANGLYAVANKIPSMLVILSTVFMEAWQMSAITENKEGKRENFFKKVFSSYQAIVFIGGSFLILFTKLITSILVSDEFYDAWNYTPFLIIAMACSCLATFMGSVYVVEKKSVMSLVTTMTGAILNIIMNFILVPIFGANGAAFATFASYLCVFIIRGVNTKRFINFNMHSVKVGFNIAILIIQSFILIFEINNWLIYEILLTLFITVINFKYVLQSIKTIFKR